MASLIVIAVAGIYIGLLIWATRTGYRWARELGWSRQKRWAAAAGGFFVVYLPLFWDLIPTLLANKYYCSTQAGLKIYKTVDQWKAEHPGIAETLRWKEIPDAIILQGGVKRTILNERFASETAKQKPISFLSTTVSTDIVFDRQSGETLAKYVMVGSGYGSSMVGDDDWRVVKSWLRIGRCHPMRNQFVDFERAVWRLGEKQ